MDDHATARAAEDRAAGKDLGPDRCRLAIPPQPRGPLKPAQEIERVVHAQPLGDTIIWHECA